MQIPGELQVLCFRSFVAPGNYVFEFGGAGTWQGDRMRHLEVESSNVDTRADAKSYSVLEMRAWMANMRGQTR